MGARIITRYLLRMFALSRVVTFICHLTIAILRDDSPPPFEYLHLIVTLDY